MINPTLDLQCCVMLLEQALGMRRAALASLIAERLTLQSGSEPLSLSLSFIYSHRHCM